MDDVPAASAWVHLLGPPSLRCGWHDPIDKFNHMAEYEPSRLNLHVESVVSWTGERWSELS